MSDNDDYEKVKASEIKVGDLVDIAKGPHFKDHPSAEFELAEVIEIAQESPDCICIEYTNVGAAGYDPDQILTIRKRKPELSLEQLVELAGILKTPNDYLNELVVDHVAAAINNSGIERQIKYLLECGVHPDTVESHLKGEV